MKHVILTCILLGNTSIAAAQRLVPFADTSGLSIEASSRLAYDGDIGGEEGGYLILRAGYYGNASDRSALRRFVSDYQGGRHYFEGYAKLALESLWELDESQECFLDLVRQWDQGTGSRWRDRARRERDPHYWTAYYAAHILVREPDSGVLASLDSVHAATNNDGQLGVAFFKARNMASALERYEQMESVSERIAWAIKWASYGGGTHGSYFSTNSFLHPKAGVGRRWLEELVQPYPQEVAQAIRAIDLRDDEGYEREELEWRVRRHLAAFTNNTIRDLLADCISDEAIYLGCRP